VTPPPRPDFLTRYEFHLTTAKFLHQDDERQRFWWDAHYGGSADLIDYVLGRASITIDYEAVMGHEYRPFDPNQGNYTLEGSMSGRVSGTEIVAVFHHVSRHLSDRPKQQAVAWNTFGLRVLRSGTLAGVTADVDVDVAHTVQKSFVDYTWVSSLDLQLRRPITSRTGLFARGSGRMFSVDGTVLRGRQVGGLIEAGIRVAGSGGVLEVFAGFERRIDAFPLEREPRDWGLAGFRLVSK
jgi:hypothetical protein